MPIFRPASMLKDQARINGVRAPMVPTNRSGNAMRPGAQATPAEQQQRKKIQMRRPLLAGAQQGQTPYQMHGGGPQSPTDLRTGAIQDVLRGKDPRAGRPSQPVVPTSARDLGLVGKEIAPTTADVVIMDGGAGTGGGGSVATPLPPGPLTEEEQLAARDKMRDEAIAELLGSDVRDTTEEERLINERLAGQMGEDLVNARASMGRAGFASSGAMGALEGDIRNQSRQAALEEIFGVQAGARDERRRDIEAGLEADRAAREDAFNQWLREQLLGMMNEGGEGGGEGGGGNVVDDFISSLPEGWQKGARWLGDVNADGEIDAEDLVSVRGLDQVLNAGRNPAEAVTAENVGDVHQPTGDEKENAAVVSSEGQVPQPSEDAGSDGGGHYYWGSDGKLYRVKLATASGDY